MNVHMELSLAPVFMPLPKVGRLVQYRHWLFFFLNKVSLL